MAFLTALSPSLTASLIWVRVCLLGPFTSRVTDRGFPHFSMNVYFSSPCMGEKPLHYIFNFTINHNYMFGHHDIIHIFTKSYIFIVLERRGKAS